MSKCKNCGRAIWFWPGGFWTHRHNDSQLCYTGPGGDYSKLATPARRAGVPQVGWLVPYPEPATASWSAW